MTWRPEDIQAFVDGELDDAGVERVLAAVAADPAAAAELEDAMQLRALVEDVAPAPAVIAAAEAAPPAPVISLAQRRSQPSRRGLVAAVVAVSALAAGAAVYLAVRAPAPAPGPAVAEADVAGRLARALGPSRRAEVRLSWSAADRHRPYDTTRAAGPVASEALDFELLARVEALRDPRALVAAHVLAGNLERADAELGAATDTADAWSDRAAVAALRGQFDTALVAADRALALAPAHPAARWNRALALVGLRLDVSAAAAFEQLAATGEPGWSAEATTRAAALRAARERAAAAYATGTTAVAALARGELPAADVVAAYPGLLRVALYDAVRAAPTADRVRALVPLARELGGEALAASVSAVAARSFARRAPLAARYAELVAGTLADPEALLRDLRRAGGDVDDLRLGALLHAGRGQVAPAAIAEYTTLAARTGDPWFAHLADEQRAGAALANGDIAGAEAALRAGAERCRAPGAIAYRCVRIARLHSHLYTVLDRIGPAREAWSRAIAGVRALALVPAEDELLWFAGRIALRRDDIGGGWAPLATAYFAEAEARGVRCVMIASGREEIAQALLIQLRRDEARAVLAASVGCAAPFTPGRAYLDVDLLRAGDRAAADALAVRVATLRAAPEYGVGERALLDHVAARIVLASDPPRGRALLAAVTELPVDDPLVAKARAYSFAALAQEAAAREAWDAVLASLAAERGLAAPARCVLGAAEEDHAVFAVRGPDGAVHGARIALAPGRVPGATPVPAAIQAALAGCETVDVLARPPFHGLAGLLPADVAIRFRVAGGPARDAAAPALTAGTPAVVVGNVAPPPELGLAPLAAIAAAPNTTLIEGPAATPARVLAALREARYVEIHGHGLAGASDDGAAMLVLSPDAAGRYGLTAAEVARTPLAGRPVVVLAACEAAAAQVSYAGARGLAEAFVEAGARAVIASPAPIGDAAAPRFFAGVRARIVGGASPAQALRDERLAWTDPTQRRWIDRLIVVQ